MRLFWCAYPGVPSALGSSGLLALWPTSRLRGAFALAR
jgi:hypothetical protein